MPPSTKLSDYTTQKEKERVKKRTALTWRNSKLSTLFKNLKKAETRVKEIDTWQQSCLMAECSEQICMFKAGRLADGVNMLLLNCYLTPWTRHVQQTFFMHSRTCVSLCSLSYCSSTLFVRSELVVWIPWNRNSLVKNGIIEKKSSPNNFEIITSWSSAHLPVVFLTEKLRVIS